MDWDSERGHDDRRHVLVGCQLAAAALWVSDSTRELDPGESSFFPG